MPSSADLALVIALLGAAPAFAQPVDAAAAESLYQEGRARWEARDFDHACPRFAASVQADPNHIDSRGHVALCHELADRLASAWTEFREVRVRAERAGRPEIVKLADEHLALLAAKVAKLTIPRPTIAGVIVRRDGVVVPPAAYGSALAIDAGTHTIAIERAGFQPWSRDLVIADGERITAELPSSLEPVAAAQSPAAPTRSTAPAPEPADVVDHSARPRPALSAPHYVALGAAGLGVVALGIGGWAGLDARSTRDRARAQGCNSDLSTCDNAVALATANDAFHRGKLATGLFAAGLGLVAVGAITWFVAAPGDGRHQQTTSWRIVPAVAPGQVGVVIGTTR